jgi:uncharacterized protein YutE (UPF0331/DUF86 family)
MVDRNIVLTRCEAIDQHLQRLEAYRAISLRQLLEDRDVQDIVEYNLFQIVNHVIDMIQHVAVDEKLGFPTTASDAGQMLFENDILKEGELDAFKQMVGFRNIVGHDYIAIDKKIAYSVLTEGLIDVRRIVSAITTRFL